MRRGEWNGALELVIVVVVAVAVIALVVWFFFFAVHPLLSGAPPV